MIKGYCKQSIHMGIIFAGFLGLFTTGCVLGVTKAKVNHNQLDHVENKKEGNILVKQFTDGRKDTQYIGNKRNAFNAVMGHIGTEEGVKLEVLLTKYFAEALKEAGYNAVVQEPGSADKTSQVKFDALLDGEILEFWMDMYWSAWHVVTVKVKAVNLATKNILWEKEIRGEGKIDTCFGTKSEYENVINLALTKALNQAVKEFSSEEFHKTIKEKAEPEKLQKSSGNMLYTEDVT